MTSYPEQKRASELGRESREVVTEILEGIVPTKNRFASEINKLELTINNISYSTDKAIAELEEKKKEIKELTDPNVAPIQQHIESIRLEQDKIVGKLLETKGIIEERTASVEQIDEIISELDREISRIQAHRTQATVDLEERLKIIKDRLKSVENLDATIDALNVAMMEVTGDYDQELSDLEKEKLNILARTDLTEEEKQRLLAEIAKRQDDLRGSHSLALDQLNQQKESALFALKAMNADDEMLDRMKNDILDEINTLEAMKINATPSQLIEINRKLALLRQQLDEIELLRELCRRGLRLTPSGHIVTSSGRILTIEEAKRLGLLDGLDIDRYLLRERLKQYGIVMTESGRFLSASGRILTIEEMKKLGFFEDVVDKEESLPQTPSTISSIHDDLISSEDVKYLKAVVGKPLTLALAEIVTKQPRDPIHYLGHWLFKYRYNQEIDEVKKKEIMELEEERERIREDRRRQDEEYAVKSCLLDIIFQAHDDASKHQFELHLGDLAKEEDEAEQDDGLIDEARDVLGELGLGNKQ